MTTATDGLVEELRECHDYGYMPARTRALVDKSADRIEAQAARIAELEGALDCAQTDLDLLRMAVEASDPQAELLIRVTDIWRRNDTALRGDGGTQP